MEIKTSSFIPGRRQFISKVLPAGALLCLGCKGLSAIPYLSTTETSPGQKQKYLDDSGMSVLDVYKFSYGSCIPTYQELAKKIGKERFLSMLTKANAEVFSQMFASMAKDYPDRSMKSLASIFQNLLSTPPFNKAFQYEIVENTDRVYEMKVTECIHATVCREMNAADIGYALECAPSDAMVKSFNPKMRAENPKNLMKGDSICIERFVLEV
jgi:hypothetical protein